MMVIAAVVGIIAFRYYLTFQAREESAGAVLPPLLNAIQIQVFNQIYGMVSRKLNDWENHRTATDYDNAQIAKGFAFKFVNSFNSMFYIAFIKRWDPSLDSAKRCQGGPADDDKNGGPWCLAELRLQLAIIFVLAIVVNNALEIGVPMLKNYLARRANTSKDSAKPKSEPEEQYELQTYDTYDDFDEMAIQFGFVSMFVVAFPIAPLCALFNNYFEIRLDAHKITHVDKRTDPEGAESIGTWYLIFDVVSYIAVVTNTAIVVFYTALIYEWTYDKALALQTCTDGEGCGTLMEANGLDWRLVLFILMEHFCLATKIGLAAIVDDQPGNIRDHLERQEYLVNVLIKGMAEDDEGEEEDVKAGEKEFKVEHLPEGPPEAYFDD